jgi:3-oxoadipate enol-lactonase
MAGILQCKQYHVLRYDRRGYGRSPAALKLYSEIDDLAALLRERRVGRAILVGAVAGGLPYSDHFITRNIANSAAFEKGDVAGGIANWANDKYVLAPSHDAARKRLFEILTASPQDLTHNDYARPLKPALWRLSEIRLPTLILTGDADIPDVHAHAGAGSRYPASAPRSR